MKNEKENNFLSAGIKKHSLQLNQNIQSVIKARDNQLSQGIQSVC